MDRNGQPAVAVSQYRILMTCPACRRLTAGLENPAGNPLFACSFCRLRFSVDRASIPGALEIAGATGHAADTGGSCRECGSVVFSHAAEVT